MVWPNTPQMPQKISAQFVCPSPKVSNFWKKKLSLGVRSPWVWKYLLRLSHLSHCREHLQYFPRTFAAPLQFLLQSLNCIGWNWKKSGFNIAHCFYCQISKVQDFYEALKATKMLSYVTAVRCLYWSKTHLKMFLSLWKIRNIFFQFFKRK